LLALGQLVQDIGGLVHPTALAACPRPHLLDRLPGPDEDGDYQISTDGKPCHWIAKDMNSGDAIVAA
jgi:hypothetical protein